MTGSKKVLSLIALCLGVAFVCFKCLIIGCRSVLCAGNKVLDERHLS